MEYISSDTNVWFDFDAISRLDIPFRLPCTYIMYEEALLTEVISPPELLQELRKLGLMGVEITTEEFFYVNDEIGKYTKLSIYDKIALAIAKKRNIPLLTGDNALRKAAKQEGVTVIGTIGLLDELYSRSLVTTEEYRDCLESLERDPERRLPTDEIRKRLEKAAQ